MILNNIIPFPGYNAINLFGVVFVRKDRWERKTQPQRAEILNHEEIHTAQMKELLYVGFYICYLFEWLYRLIFHTSTAYRGISFEREAYEHQSDLDYLDTREHFAEWK